jgi:hypothetical protein
MTPDGQWIHGITTMPDPEFPDLFVVEVPLLMSLTYTRPDSLAGDYNGNGAVEQADLDLVLLNWGDAAISLPPTWTNERPRGGIVDQAELDRVLLNWGNAIPRGGSAAVPEPATVLLVGLFLAAVSTRAYCRLWSTPRGGNL